MNNEWNALPEHLRKLDDLISPKEMAVALISYDEPNAITASRFKYERKVNQTKWVIYRLISDGRILATQRGQGMHIRIRKQDAIDYITKGIKDDTL